MLLRTVTPFPSSIWMDLRFSLISGYVKIHLMMYLPAAAFESFCMMRSPFLRYSASPGHSGNSCPAVRVAAKVIVKEKHICGFLLSRKCAVLLILLPEWARLPIGLIR
jgi:hypothetical protein